MSEPVPVCERPTPQPPQLINVPEFSQLQAALDAIPNNETDSLDYDAWRNIIFGIHDATAGSDTGLALAHSFSAKSPKYDPQFLDARVWPYVGGNRDSRITARTIFAVARKHGWSDIGDDDFDVLPPVEPSVLVADVPPDRTATTAGETLLTTTAHERFAVLDESALLSRPRPQWYVKGVLLKAELSVLYGASGSGKTFVALDLFAAVARGAPWREFKTKQASVVYIAAEGQGGFRNRLEAYQQAHNGPSGLRVILDTPNLLKTDAKPVAAQIVLAGGCEIIVIDTLAQVSPGGDENSAEDMGKVLANCRLLRRATGAMIVLIHHAGKDLTKGARGWSGLKAAADSEIEIARENGDRWVRISKNKDGEDGAVYPFKLTPVVIGVDEDGDEITSCVVEHIARKGSKHREPHGRVERIVWRVTHDLVDLCGDEVSVLAVLTEAAKRLPHDADSGGRDRRREVARRAMLGLSDEGWLVIIDDNVRVKTC